MGLSQEDIEVVQKTWKIIMENEEEAGVIILKTFLDKYDYYHKFERFRDHPRETIHENRVFRNHALNIMKSLNEAFTNLDNPTVFTEVLNKLGTSHGRRKIEEKQFLELKEVILGILVQHYNLSKENLDVWDRVLSAAVQLISKSL